MQSNGLYEGLISDFDGVLLPNSEEVNVMAICETMREQRFLLSEWEIGYIPGKSCVDLLPEFLGSRGVDRKHYMSIIEKNRAHYDRIWDDRVQLDPAIEETLRKLHERNIPIAIATTNRSKVVNKFLGRFCLGDVITTVVASDDITRRKPDPEVYTIASRRLGEKRCLAAEDMPIGVLSARGAGIHCAAIPNRYSLSLDFSNATYVLKSFPELLQFF